MNLITTRREFTLLLYSTTLSSIIASFCIIFDICYMMNQQYYIYSRTLQVLFQHAALNLITTKWEFTLLQYSLTLLSIIASFCLILMSATWWTNSAIYIPEHSQYWFQHAALNLITKSSEFTLLQYSTTLSNIITSSCIIFNICYMMNQQYYIYSRTPQVLFQHAALNLITKSSEFTLLQYSTTLSSIITSSCIIFNICYVINQQYYIYSRTLQVLFQHAALNLITKSSEFTLLQYSTTLSNIITSSCIIFNICYMMNQQYYIYSRIPPVLISTCCIEFTLLLYSTTLSSIIASFCIIFDVCYMRTNSTIYIPEYSQYWFQHAALNLITKSSEFTLLQYSTTLSNIITSFCIIFDICNMINYRFAYIPEYFQYWFQHAALNLITKSSELTLLKYFTTL